MKTSNKLIGLLILIGTLVWCGFMIKFKANVTPQQITLLRSDGPVKSKTLGEVKHQVFRFMAHDFHLDPNSNVISIEGPQDIVDFIEYDKLVNDNYLHFSDVFNVPVGDETKRVSIQHPYTSRLKFTIGVKDLTDINIYQSGNSNITVGDTISVNSFLIDNSFYNKKSKSELLVDADIISVKLNRRAGDVSVKGNCNLLNLTLEGSSIIKASELIAERAILNIGSGCKADLNVDGQLIGIGSYQSTIINKGVELNQENKPDFNFIY